MKHTALEKANAELDACEWCHGPAGKPCPCDEGGDSDTILVHVYVNLPTSVIERLIAADHVSRGNSTSYHALATDAAAEAAVLAADLIGDYLSDLAATP